MNYYEFSKFQRFKTNRSKRHYSYELQSMQLGPFPLSNSSMGSLTRITAGRSSGTAISARGCHAGGSGGGLPGLAAASYGHAWPWPARAVGSSSGAAAEQQDGTGGRHWRLEAGGHSGEQRRSSDGRRRRSSVAVMGWRGGEVGGGSDGSCELPVMASETDRRRRPSRGRESE